MDIHKNKSMITNMKQATESIYLSLRLMFIDRFKSEIPPYNIFQLFNKLYP